MLQLPVYLDNNSTTKMDARVLKYMLPYFTEYYGNAASRSHSLGWQAEEAVEYAREKVAALINAEPSEIIFTSGATESDNLALKGIFEAYAAKGNHIITLVTEHKAVLDSCKHIEKLGGEVTYLTVNNEGLVNLNELENAIKPTTILIGVMYVNNETGVIQPIKKISAIAKKHHVLFFTDATQAVGKIKINVSDDDIDIMSFSSHKMYGPKGIGALYVRRKNPRVTIIAQMDGGGHEKNKRSGTLNVPAIAGFGKACELCKNEMIANEIQIKILRDRLENELLKSGNVIVNGDKKNRLYNVSNLGFKDVDSEALMLGFNKKVAVSSGSACSSSTPEPSYVLKAMGIDDGLAKASIRFSLSRFTTGEEIDYAIQQVRNSVSMLKYGEVFDKIAATKTTN